MTQGCDIPWADETGLSNEANCGRSVAPEGRPRSSGARPGAQSMISSLTNRGKRRLMIYEGALKATIFLNFLRRLIREAAEPRRVFRRRF